MRNTERDARGGGLHSSPEGFPLLRDRAWQVVRRSAVGSEREGNGKGSGGGHAWSRRIWRRPCTGTRLGGRAARSTHGEHGGRAARTKEDGVLALVGKATPSPPTCLARSRVKTRSSNNESVIVGPATGRGSRAGGRSWGGRLVKPPPVALEREGEGLSTGWAGREWERDRAGWEIFSVGPRPCIPFVYV